MSGNVNNLLDGKFPKAPLDQVISWERDGYYFAGAARFNPDQLGGRDGMRTYKKMRIDEQVKAVMNFKRDAIFARGWTFSFASGTKLSDEEQATRISVAKAWVEKIRGSFIDALNCVATGRDFGYSLTEKVYSSFEHDGRNYIGVSKLKGRDPTTFEFQTDEWGELVRCEQLAAGKRQEIDLRKFIHYVHNPEFDEYYGRSDLREAYKPWYWKNQMMDLMLTYGERMAGGFVTIQRDANATGILSPADRNKLDEVVENLRTVTGIVLPAGYTLTVHSPAATDFFMRVVEFFDLAIARSLLVPNLLGVSHTGQTGAFAQSQTQLEAFFWTLNADKVRLQSCLNEQLFRDLGDQNWGDGEYPHFEFKELSSETLKWLVQTWSGLVGSGIVIATEEDERLLRARLEMPERNEQSVPLVRPRSPDAMNPDAEDDDEEVNDDAEGQAVSAEAAEEVGDEDEDEEDDVEERVEQAVKRALDSFTASRKAQPVSKELAFSRALMRVHFTVIGDRHLAMANDLTARLAQQAAVAVADLLGTVEQTRVMIETDIEDVAAIALPPARVSKIKDTIKRALGTAWSLGQSHAQNEVARAVTEFNRRAPDRAVKVSFAALRDNASAFFEANGFRMAGNLADGVRGILQQELQNGIKYGKSPEQVRTDIWDRLVAKGMTTREQARGVETDEGVQAALDALWLDTEEEATAYLNTLTRTNLFEAMNEARYAEFTDPELGDFVEGLEYSAVLDGRTTEICSALDGCTLRADNVAWDTLRPPNHFNCRSLLIPVTALDGWDGTETAIPDVQPQEGFK